MLIRDHLQYAKQKRISVPPVGEMVRTISKRRMGRTIKNLVSVALVWAGAMCLKNYLS